MFKFLPVKIKFGEIMEPPHGHLISVFISKPKSAWWGNSLTIAFVPPVDGEYVYNKE